MLKKFNKFEQQPKAVHGQVCSRMGVQEAAFHGTFVVTDFSQEY